MQATRNFIGVVIEFSTGMQNSHDNFCRGSSLFLMDIDRNATTIIGNRNGFIDMDNDFNFRTKSRQGLIDGIVHDFEYHMMQTGPIISVSYIHPWAFSNGIESF